MTKKEDTCLYFHINPLKNKVFYVGIGSKNRAYSKRGRNKFWHRSVNKYGFIVDIIETNLEREEANRLEIFYVAKIGRRNKGKGPLTNLNDGGDSWTDERRIAKKEAMSNGKSFHCGRKRSEETKSNISKSKIGKKCPMREEAKEKHRIRLKANPPRKGFKTSEATKKLLSDINKGKKLSLETRANMSEGQKKKIIQYELDGVTLIKEFNSLGQIKEELGFSQDRISKMAKEEKPCCGFIWKFATTV